MFVRSIRARKSGGLTSKGKTITCGRKRVDRIDTYYEGDVLRANVYTSSGNIFTVDVIEVLDDNTISSNSRISWHNTVH